MRTQLVLLLGIAQGGFLGGGRLLAQQLPGRIAEGAAMGVSIDRFIYEGAGITAMSFRMSALHQISAGTELGISFFLEALPAGVLLMAPDLGASYGISLPVVTVLLKAGGSALAGLGPGAAIVVPGVHLGGGLIVQTNERSGVRLDLIRHFYLADGDRPDDAGDRQGPSWHGAGKRAGRTSP